MYEVCPFLSCAIQLHVYHNLDDKLGNNVLIKEQTLSVLPLPTLRAQTVVAGGH